MRDKVNFVWLNQEDDAEVSRPLLLLRIFCNLRIGQ